MKRLADLGLRLDEFLSSVRACNLNPRTMGFETFAEFLSLIDYQTVPVSSVSEKDGSTTANSVSRMSTA